MAKYRKKPVTIEAHRIGDDGWPDSIWRGVNEGTIIPYLDTDPFGLTAGFVEINAQGGVVAKAEIGDWLILHGNGKYTVCKPGAFNATYEPVEGEGT